MENFNAMAVLTVAVCGLFVRDSDAWWVEAGDTR